SVTLASGPTTAPTHADGTVLFIGWSQTQTSILEAADTLPADIVYAGAPFTVAANTNLYAVWVFDSDGSVPPSGGGSGTGNATVVNPEESVPPEPPSDPGYEIPEDPSDPGYELPEESTPIPSIVLIFLIALGAFIFVWRRKEEEGK
ncbi:MAG: hypothetical protein LBE57_01005, partial [Methanosarcinales archaeon]|nr:hypothetical protein [Methanosarcinales archaeon]